MASRGKPFLFQTGWGFEIYVANIIVVLCAYALLRFHQIKPTVPINANGIAARYKIPLFKPLALLAPRPAAVFVHTAQPCAHISEEEAIAAVSRKNIFFMLQRYNNPVKESLSPHCRSH